MKTFPKPTALEKRYAKKYGVEVERIYTLENTDIVMITHSPSQCVAQVCVVHNKTDHSMRSFPQHWRSDRGIFERICSHGAGHPDEDQIPFWKATRGEDWKYEMVHGCCGCCCRPNTE